MFGADMAMFFYRQHYDQKIGPNLTNEQKRDIARRISDLTLNEPFTMTDVDYTSRFPELKPFVNTPISGLYLVAIMEGMMSDLGYPRMGGPFSKSRSKTRRREVRVRSYPRKVR